MDTNYLLEYVNDKISHLKMQEDIVDFWETEKVLQQSEERLKKSNIYTMMHSPLELYTSCPSKETISCLIKTDIFARYKRLNGFNVNSLRSFSAFTGDVEERISKSNNCVNVAYLNDYLTHEQKISFQKKCIDLVDERATEQRHVIDQLGIATDWRFARYTYQDSNIEHVWYFLSLCLEKGYLSFSSAIILWCHSCQLAMNPLECDEYSEMLASKGVYVALPLLGLANTKFVVHLESIWHVFGIAGIVAHPDYEYCEVNWNGCKYIVGKKNAPNIFGYDLILENTVRGKDLDNAKFIMPSELGESAPLSVTCSSRVNIDPESYTGLCALLPALKQLHFEKAKEDGLIVKPLLDVRGKLVTEKYNGESVSGRFTMDVEHKLLSQLKKGGFLLTEGAGNRIKYSASSIRNFACPHCSNSVLPHIRKDWMLNLGPAKFKLYQTVHKMKWLGTQRQNILCKHFAKGNYLPIKKAGIWGVPLPFYYCSQCKIFNCIGSRKELIERAIDSDKAQKIPRLLIPHLDDIRIACVSCKQPLFRIHGVVEDWLTNAVGLFAATEYVSAINKGRHKEWRTTACSYNWLPVDFMTDWSIKNNWSLYVNLVSFVQEGQSAALKGFGKNPENQTFSLYVKKGSRFDQFRLKDYATDYVRMAVAASDAILYGKEREFKQFFSSVIMLLIPFTRSFGSKDVHSDEGPPCRDFLDQWIHARFDQTIFSLQRNYEEIELLQAIDSIKSFFSDILDWYRPLKQKRELDTREHVFYLIKNALIMLAPLAPFLAELLWQTILRPLCLDLPLSVFLCRFPVPRKKAAEDESILYDFKVAQKIISFIESSRVGRSFKNRHLLPRLLINPHTLAQREAITRFHQLIAQELNVASVEFVKEITYPLYASCIQTQVDEMRIWLDTSLEGDFLHFNLAKEVVHVVKKMKVDKIQECVIYVDGCSALHEMSNKYKSYILQETKVGLICVCAPPASVSCRETVNLGRNHFTVSLGPAPIWSS
jgi:isoleucyl-tRNA synthetase